MHTWVRKYWRHIFSEQKCKDSNAIISIDKTSRPCTFSLFKQVRGESHIDFRKQYLIMTLAVGGLLLMTFQK